MMPWVRGTRATPVDSTRRKPRLEYPCRWVYKIIGADRSAVHEAAGGIAGERPHMLSLSNTSARGTYCCMNLEMTVESEEERLEIYEALCAHSSIKMVL